MKTQPHFKIVVLEDDDFFNRMLSSFLERHLRELGKAKGFVVTVSSYTSFTDCSLNLDPATTLLFTDYYLANGYKAPDMMQRMQQRGLHCKVIVMSRIQNVQTALTPIIEGASEFVNKNQYALNRCLLLAETILLERLAFKTN